MHPLILIMTLGATLVGAWELMVTRLASVFFFIGITHLVLGISLLGFSLGAIAAARLPSQFSVSRLMVMTFIMMPPCWSLLSMSDLAWVCGLFAWPFVSFGAASTNAWREMNEANTRAGLYFGESVGTVLGLVLLGPLVLGVVPINSLGNVGFNNHLKELVETDGLVSHEQYTNTYAATDIIRTNRTDTVYFFTDARFLTRAVAWDGTSSRFSSAHLENLARLKRLALESAETRDVLLLGAGAGFDVAVALQSGAERVDAVEVNAVTIEIARDLEAWSGGVLNDPRVNVHIAEARRFVSMQEETWDHINLTLIQTSPSTGRGTSHVDGRVLTRDAITQYLARLNPRGTIAIIQNSPELAERTTATALSVVEADQVLRYALTPKEHATNPFNHLILIGRDAFPTSVVERLARAAGRIGAIIQPLNPTSKPLSDDQPFVFESLMSSTIHVLTAALFALFVFVLLLTRHRAEPGRNRIANAALLTGLLMMAAQAFIIYRAQAALGSPVLALSLALSATLLGAGTGAIMFRRARISWRSAGLLALAGILLLGAASGVVTEVALSMPVVEASLAFAGFTFLCTLPLGLPFLAVMHKAKELGPGNEGIVLAGDGFGGVVGAAFATTVAMALGFNALILGLALILLVFIALDDRQATGP